MGIRKPLIAARASAHFVAPPQLRAQAFLGKPPNAPESLGAVAVVKVARPTAQGLIDLRDHARHRHRGAANARTNPWATARPTWRTVRAKAAEPRIADHFSDGPPKKWGSAKPLRSE